MARIRTHQWRKLRLWLVGVVLLSGALLGVLLIPNAPKVEAACSTPLFTPKIVTDKTDYSPGEIVHIEGCGFQAYNAQALPLNVTRPNGVDSTTVTIASGAFTYDYVLDGVLGQYLVEVLNASQTTVLASTTFTDSAVQEFDQCANSKPADIPVPDSDPLDCSPEGWINGILNPNNSHYGEDDSTAQRLLLDLPAGGATTGRSVEITYQARKGSVHAYDSLATWNLTQTTADRCQGLAGPDCVGGSPMTFAIPDDPTAVNSSVCGSSVTTGHMIAAGAGRELTMYGGTITGVSAPVHDNAASGTMDDYAAVTVTYSVSSLPTKVMLLWGGHIAATGGPRGWGAGCGAGSISGGPYHMKLTAADGSSIGNRDNQIQAEALVPTPTPTNTITPTATNTFTPTATNTFTPTATNTFTPTATNTFTPTATNTFTPTATNTFTPTATNTFTPTATNTFTPTATNTFTPTATNTFTPTATNTFTPTATNTFTPTATNTFTPTATNTPVTPPTNTPVTPMGVTVTPGAIGGLSFDPNAPPGSSGPSAGAWALLLAGVTAGAVALAGAAWRRRRAG